MRETENLSRHEQLRLDYLHTNYYYLNEHEKDGQMLRKKRLPSRPCRLRQKTRRRTHPVCYPNTRVKVLLAEVKRIPAIL